MNKRELVGRVAARTKQQEDDVAEVVDEVIRVISTSVARGEKVVLSGFGTFYRRSRARRVARNIWANEALPLPAANVPAFRPGKPFREAVMRRRRRAAATPTRPRRR
jgi:DNA-binding protein HU-beta